MNSRYPIGRQCGHVGCPDRRCWWHPSRPHTPANPDRGDECRCCGARMAARNGRADGAWWGVCERCGTGRWVTG